MTPSASAYLPEPEKAIAARVLPQPVRTDFCRPAKAFHRAPGENRWNAVFCASRMGLWSLVKNAGSVCLCVDQSATRAFIASQIEANRSSQASKQRSVAPGVVSKRVENLRPRSRSLRHHHHCETSNAPGRRRNFPCFQRGLREGCEPLRRAASPVSVSEPPPVSGRANLAQFGSV